MRLEIRWALVAVVVLGIGATFAESYAKVMAPYYRTTAVLLSVGRPWEVTSVAVRPAKSGRSLELQLHGLIRRHTEDTRPSALAIGRLQIGEVVETPVVFWALVLLWPAESTRRRVVRVAVALPAFLLAEAITTTPHLVEAMAMASATLAGDPDPAWFWWTRFLEAGGHFVVTVALALIVVAATKARRVGCAALNLSFTCGLLVTILGTAPIPARAAPPTPLVQRSPAIAAAVHHDLSQPLRSMRPAVRRAGQRVIPVRPLPRLTGQHLVGAAGVDRVLQSSVPIRLMPAPSANFSGIGQGFSGPAGSFTVTAAPPDTDGAAGLNHYVQIVNTDFAVFNKSGMPLYGPVPTNTLWSGFGGGCQANDNGDGTVLYDPIADRWIITQFSVSTTPYLQCVAVSQSGDPTGAYYRYAFQYANFPDYTKLAVWPDAYYATFNQFDSTGTIFLGGLVCAYNRTAMLSGAAATQQCFNVGTSFGGLLPADMDGGRQPPAGSPNYVLSLASTTQLAFWQFHIDWTTPANTTLTGPTTLTVSAFSEACGGGTCIPQSGTAQQLDSLADRLMYRLAYRNFGDHESLVVNHSVTAGTSVGVRWYELRLDAGHNPSLYQQGTYAPDSNYRWMGSIAQDQMGDMALGFSVSASALNPQVHYAGRLSGDALGTLGQGESILINGTGSQLPTLSRWGDYSAMSVDPIDDCTFYYTNEYLSTNGTFNWQTRIGSFKFPSCPPVSVTATSVSVTTGQSVTLTATPSGSGPFTYQWYQGLTGNVAVPIPGATAATYTTPPLGATTRYWVQVTSSNGKQNSATVTITVSAATALDTTDSAGPLPLWALVALGAGLVGIASRRLKKAA